MALNQHWPEPALPPLPDKCRPCCHSQIPGAAESFIESLREFCASGNRVISASVQSVMALPTARRGLQSSMSPIQAEVERRGMQIFDLVDRHPQSIFSKAGFYQRMMEFSMRDEHFKVQMFRFVDVLASLRRGSDIVQHLDEYFADLRNGYAPLIRTGVSLARIVPIISGKFLRWNVSGMARQFIAGRNP